MDIDFPTPSAGVGGRACPVRVHERQAQGVEQLFDDRRGRGRYDQTRGQIWRGAWGWSWYKSGARGADMTISQGDFIPGIFIFIYRGEIYYEIPLRGIVTTCTYPRTIIAQYMRDSADFDPRFIKSRCIIIYILP